MLQHLGALENELKEKLKLVREKKKAYEVRLGALQRVSVGVPQGWEWMQDHGDYTGCEGGQGWLADWTHFYATEKERMQGDIIGEIKQLREEGWLDDSSKWTEVAENEVDKDLKALGIGVDAEMQPIEDH